MFAYGISAAGQRVSNVGDPTMATDALNRRSGDGRYLQLAAGGIVGGPLMVMTTPVVDYDAANKVYVDRRRAPAAVFDLPANVTVPGDGGWHEIARVPFAISRGGSSLIMVNVSCNVTNAPNIALIGVRFGSGAAERRVFTYGGGPPENNVSGFFVSLTAVVVGDDISIPIQMSALSTGGAPPPFTIVGGNDTVAARSQIVIVDLGPVPAAEEGNSVSVG